MYTYSQRQVYVYVFSHPAIVYIYIFSHPTYTVWSVCAFALGCIVQGVRNGNRFHVYIFLHPTPNCRRFQIIYIYIYIYARLEYREAELLRVCSFACSAECEDLL